MRILIDMGHPAHVHFFKNAIAELSKQGHSVKVTARDRDVTIRLLEAYDIPYAVRPSGWRPLNLFLATRFVQKAARDFKADVLVGVHNPYVAGAAVQLGKRCVLFTDTPGSAFVNRISLDRASAVVTPACLDGLFRNQTTYPGYKEMAYLHPKYFKPDASALERAGVSSGYFLARFISWDAHHDSGVNLTGEDVRAALVFKLGKTLLSLEGCDDGLRPQDLHSLLAHSSGCVSEGATLAKEAAVLGVPSAYVSPLAESLPPIMEMARTGRLRAFPDFSSVELPPRSGPMEMCDVTSVIIKSLENP
jgi:predicted glycosyltransferase